LPHSRDYRSQLCCGVCVELEVYAYGYLTSEYMNDRQIFYDRRDDARWRVSEGSSISEMAVNNGVRPVDNRLPVTRMHWANSGEIGGCPMGPVTGWVR
jgi:hypothetical protein